MKIPFLEGRDQPRRSSPACATTSSSRGYIRPIVFYGSNAMGVAAKSNPVIVAIAVWPWGAYLGADAIEKGIRVRTSSFTHHHPNITMCNAKAVCNYAVSILANQEATHDGYEEAMLLDPQGFVCQGSGENVFIVRDGKLHTPDLSGGALNGITRDRSSRSRTSSAFRSSSAGSRATRSTSATRPSSPARRPRSRPSANTTTARSARASAARSPTKLQALFFDTVNGRNPSKKAWLDEGVTMAEADDVAAVPIDPKDLPAFCPNPQMPLWSSHPRVFLDIAETGAASCPYCGTRYALVGGPLKGGGH